MVQQSKFSGALARLRNTPEPETATPTAEPDAAQTPVERPAAPAPKRGRGRPLGKRSDPEFKPTTLFLRTQTKRVAARLLEDRGEGQDLSELVEELLAKWSKRNG